MKVAKLIIPLLSLFSIINVKTFIKQLLYYFMKCESICNCFSCEIFEIYPDFLFRIEIKKRSNW